jgi:hypothetical protein
MSRYNLGLGNFTESSFDYGKSTTSEKIYCSLYKCNEIFKINYEEIMHREICKK